MEPIILKFALFSSHSSDGAATSIWDYRALKSALHKNYKIVIGGTIEATNGDKFVITDIQFEVLPNTEDNEYGVDLSQRGESGKNNSILNVFVKQA